MDKELARQYFIRKLENEIIDIIATMITIGINKKPVILYEEEIIETYKDIFEKIAIKFNCVITYNIIKEIRILSGLGTTSIIYNTFIEIMEYNNQINRFNIVNETKEYGDESW